MNDEKKQADFYTRLIAFLPLPASLKNLCLKQKEMILYLFFGGLAFLVSMSTYALFIFGFRMPLLWGNALSWFVTVLFAFFTNRIWVFSAPTKGAGDFLRQLLSFYGGRLLTLGMEEAILYIFITRLGLPNLPVKVVAQILVIVLNYVISKLLIFRNKDR